MAGERTVVVLGVDPALCNFGIAAVALTPGGGERVVETLVIRTEPSPKKRRVLAGSDNARRVAELVAGLDGAVARHKPVAIVVETPGGSKGAKAAAALASAMAVVIAVASLRGLPLVQCTPLDVKRAVCGHKKAEKEDIIIAIEARYPDLPEWPTPASVAEHAADAIGAVLAALDSETLRMARRLAT